MKKYAQKLRMQVFVKVLAIDSGKEECRITLKQRTVTGLFSEPRVLPIPEILERVRTTLLYPPAVGGIGEILDYYECDLYRSFVNIPQSAKIAILDASYLMEEDTAGLAVVIKDLKKTLEFKSRRSLTDAEYQAFVSLNNKPESPEEDDFIEDYDTTKYAVEYKVLIESASCDFQS